MKEPIAWWHIPWWSIAVALLGALVVMALAVGSVLWIIYSLLRLLA